MTRSDLQLTFTPDELVEISNSVVLSAYAGLTEPDDEAYRVAQIALQIADKIEQTWPDIIEEEGLMCTREVLVLRKKLAHR